MFTYINQIHTSIMIHFQFVTQIAKVANAQVQLDVQSAILGFMLRIRDVQVCTILIVIIHYLTNPKNNVTRSIKICIILWNPHFLK